MSKRRQIGDLVLVTYRRGADSYLCQVDGLGEPGSCINHEFFKLGRPFQGKNGKVFECNDPNCREWPNLKVIQAYGTDRQHYNEKDYLYHVPECQMEDANEKSTHTETNPELRMERFLELRIAGKTDSE